MSEVWIAAGTSAQIYHTQKHCYQAQKSDALVKKSLEMIQIHYSKCSDCEEWEKEK